MAVSALEEGRLPLLARGAELELERLYAKHELDVRRYVRMVLRNRNDAEDVVQQTFMKALRALQAGVRPEKPRQWLVAIAHNECRMLFRHAARRPLEVELDQAAEAAAAEDGAVSAEAIREALGQLAPNQRAALVMRELDDRSYAEIAVALGVSESAVETLIFRARRALREQIEAAGGCDEAQALLAADSLDELARKRLRAHIRTCRACATLERRRRGKMAAAARKLAGLIPAPSWLTSLLGGGGTKAAAAVAAAAVATTGAVEVAKPGAHPRKPEPAPASVHRVPGRPAAVAPAAHASPVRAAPTAKAAVAKRSPRAAVPVKHAAVVTPAGPPSTPAADPQPPAQASSPAPEPAATPAQPAAVPAAQRHSNPTPPDPTPQGRPTLPDVPKVEPPQSQPPGLPSLPPVAEPQAVPVPQLPPAGELPGPPQQLPAAPSVNPPAVPPVQTPTPTLTKP